MVLNGCAVASSTTEKDVFLVAVQRSGGGSEANIAALYRVLSEAGVPCTHFVISEEIRARGMLLRLLAWLACKVSVNALYALLPAILPRRRVSAVIFIFGKGNVVVPILSLLGIPVITVCDVPRPVEKAALKRLVEWACWRGFSFSRTYVRAFDFVSTVRGPHIFPPLEKKVFDAKYFCAMPIVNMVFVGRLAKEKGISEFLVLAGQLPSKRFVVFGDGPLRNIVLSYASTHDNVEYRGHRANWLEELQPGSCLLGCCPYEGSWTAGREALLHGIPFIAVASVKGGPESYRKYTDKVIITKNLSAGEILMAIGALEENLSRSCEPALALFEECKDDTIARKYTDILVDFSSRKAVGDQSRME